MSGFPAAQPIRLANGLRVLLVERHDLPLVHVGLTVLSGSTSDPRSRPGTAYATAAMVDEGAGRRSALQIAAAMQQIGSALFTLVDYECTAFSFQVLRRNLDRGLDLLADVIRRPHLSGQELDRVRDELANRALERRASPSWVASLNLRGAVFGRHPYARPVLPRPDEVVGISRRDLVAFHGANYRPPNILAVVAGAVTAHELERKLRVRLGSWQGRVPSRQRSPGPPSRGPRLVLVDRPGAVESELAVGHLASRPRAGDHAGIQALNTILGGSFTSRLNQNLREAHGWTYGAASSFALMRRQALFSIHASVETAVTVQALAEVLKELRRLLDHGVQVPELAKARRLLTEALPARAETIRGLVDAHTELATIGLARGTLERLPRRLERLTVEEVDGLARWLLDPDRATIVVVGDAARIAGPLQEVYGTALFRDADGRALEQPRLDRS